jgi:5-methylcytosine-specific restriction endonuclease McrA
MTSVLLLNADAQPLSLLPLSTISWQNAVKAYFQEKVKIIKNYDDLILHSASFEMPCPSVVMLNRFHKRPNRAKFNRRNMFIRDNHTCQYCGCEHHADELTLDHVVPRAAGGKTSWTNCTTACKSCNTRKGSATHIKPIRMPQHPTWHEINYSTKFFRITIPDEHWQNFLQWPEDLVTINENLAHLH